MNKSIMFVMLASLLGGMAYVATMETIVRVYAQEPNEKTIVLFLIGSTCDQFDNLTAKFPDAYVYCSGENNIAWARLHYSGFEQLYHIVYVTDDNQDILTASSQISPYGMTLDNYHYSVSISFEKSIRHELEHQYCACFYTPDGLHGSPTTGAKN